MFLLILLILLLKNVVKNGIYISNIQIVSSFLIPELLKNILEKEDIYYFLL